MSTVTRNPLAPEVPTMQEAGVPGYSSQGAFGLFALFMIGHIVCGVWDVVLRGQ